MLNEIDCTHKMSTKLITTGTGIGRGSASRIGRFEGPDEKIMLLPEGIQEYDKDSQVDICHTMNLNLCISPQ